MNNQKNNLKFYSIFFIILAIFDFISLFMGYSKGDFKLEKIANGVPNDIAQILLIVLISIVVVIALIKLFLGVQGLKQVNGQKTGKSHIIVAKIGFVIFIISLISLAIGAFQGKSDWWSMLNSLASSVILYEYIKDANALKTKTD